MGWKLFFLHFLSSLFTLGVHSHCWTVQCNPVHAHNSRTLWLCLFGGQSSHLWHLQDQFGHCQVGHSIPTWTEGKYQGPSMPSVIEHTALDVFNQSSLFKWLLVQNCLKLNKTTLFSSKSFPLFLQGLRSVKNCLLQKLRILKLHDPKKFQFSKFHLFQKLLLFQWLKKCL